MLEAPIDPIAAVSHPDRYPYNAALRAESGLHWFADRELWALVSVPLVTVAFDMQPAKARPPGEPVPAFLEQTRAGNIFGRLARMSDGPPHAEQRARTMQLMRRLIGEMVAAGAAQAIDAVASPWRERMDGVSLNALIRALPVMAVLATFGFAPPTSSAVLASIDTWVAGLSALATDGQRADAVEAMEGLLPLLAAHGVQGLDDAAAHVAVSMQPHEATAGLIGAGLLRLAADQGLRNAAVAASLRWDHFAEEVLRHDLPIQNTRRVMAADVAIEGRRVHAGDTVVLVVASAARDLSAHDAPDEFRLGRLRRTTLPPSAGVHACPGGPAALATAQWAWRHIAQQCAPDGLAALAGGVTWRPSVNARIPVFAR
ncbi:MAG: cytochrome P450 [Rubrivivax sp.]|nr:cytochrome P450 [Rubrivivax sp.]